MSNLAYKYEDIRTEMLDGKIYAMASASPKHARVSLRISKIFDNYLRGKRCEVFPAVDVFLSENDTPVPDISVVCNKDIIKDKGLYGAPDLVVEILSRSTAKHDKVYKKALYGQHGVKEYWVVDPENHSIEVFLLQDNKLEFNDMYTLFDEFTLSRMCDTKKAELVVNEFKTSLFDDLVIKLEDIFEDVV